MSAPTGFSRYYKNTILAAIQLELGTTARGRDLIEKIRELRRKAGENNNPRQLIDENPEVTA